MERRLSGRAATTWSGKLPPMNHERVEFCLPMTSRKFRSYSPTSTAPCTNEKILTERARKAVHGLHRAGIRFAITSGRPPRGMAMFVEPLAL